MLDQILFALPARQLLRLLVELDADGAVDLLRFGGEGLYYVLCPRLVSGAPQAADALWSEGQLHSAVDPLEHARQLPLALDEHDAPYAGRPACDPLRDPDDFHAAFPVPNPYAVVPRAELIAHLTHLGHHPEPRECAEDEGRCFVVAFPDAASRLLLVSGPDDRETEGAPVRGGRAAARGADEHGIAHLPGGPDSVFEARTERVAARDPDVAGRRCDRDRRRPCAPRHLVEDGPHVAVGGRRLFEPARQEKLHRRGLTPALHRLLLAASREPVDEESGKQQAETREHHGNWCAYSEALRPSLD